MSTRNFVLSIQLAGLVLVPGFAQAKWFSSFDETKQSVQIENILQNMDLRTKVGQLFIFGFMGTKAEKSLNRTIAELRPGAIIVFGRNIETARQMAEMNFSAQTASFKHTGVPLLIALDQEGGDVTRIKLDPPIPSALSIGMSGDPIVAERMGYLIGEMLSSMGFNMNLAPVLDLSDPDVASFIGTRSFGNDPYSVGHIASAFARGLDMAKVLSTAKHFPGHGNVIANSHMSLPHKNSTVTDLMKADLLPYTLFSESLKTSAVMIAHVAFPNIDKSQTPATFSKIIINDLLRRQMKYNGLVLTDDIEMAAVSGVKKFEERAIRSIKAGNDMVMVAWNHRAQRAAVNAVIKAVKTGKIKKTTLNDAVRRVLTAKARYTNLDRLVKPNLEIFKKVISSQYIQNLSHDILDKNFHQSMMNLREDSFVWTNRPVYVYSGANAFYNEFKKATQLKSYRVRYSKANPGLFGQKLIKNSKNYGVFYVSGRISAKMANRLPLKVKKRTVLVNGSLPGLIDKPSNFLSILNVFSDQPKAGRLVAENIIRHSDQQKKTVVQVRSPAAKDKTKK